MTTILTSAAGLFFLWFLPGYLPGSIPFGYVFGRLKGIDIRQHGSGNIGATNVWRVMGRGWGIATFVLDFAKGPIGALLAMGVAKFFPPGVAAVDGWEAAVRPLLPLVGAVVGHNFPVWLGFRGGKGVATSAGALLWLFPKVFPVVLLVWAVFFAAFRYVSLASMAASVVLPVGVWFLYPGRPLYFWLCCFLGAMSVWRHRSNIQRLIKGTESRWGRKEKG
ncbi:MAG: glycerol-3-phosphate 1-O-acyltransferase PlsY [Verrucomicrobiae bacterium]|nr:glycerol-3-phosphate 1-O-acyltransferase PlsY [Verrucomicrobiae bacterium]